MVRRRVWCREIKFVPTNTANPTADGEGPINPITGRSDSNGGAGRRKRMFSNEPKNP